MRNGGGGAQLIKRRKIIFIGYYSAVFCIKHNYTYRYYQGYIGYKGL